VFDLVVTKHPQNSVGTGFKQADHFPQSLVSGIDDFQADQIAPVELIFLGRRQGCLRSTNQDTLHCFSSSSVVDTIEQDNQTIAVHLQAFQPAFTPLLAIPADPPDGHLCPVQRVVTKSMQLQPATNSVRVGKPPQNDDIVASQSKNNLSSLLSSVLLDQTSNSRGKLGTILLPVGQAIHGDAQGFGVTGGNRVVETDTLDETAITTVTGIGNNHVVERALLGATTGKTDNNHEITFVSWKKDRRL